MRFSFITSFLTFYLKAIVVLEGQFVKTTNPNTILKVIPLGSRNKTIPVNQISSVDDSFSLDFKSFLWGVLFTVLGCYMMGDSLVGGLVIAIYGVLTVLSSFQTILVLNLTSGGVHIISVLFFEKEKLLKCKDVIEGLIQNRFNDTNVRIHTDRAMQNTADQTDRMINAFNNNFDKLTQINNYNGQHNDQYNSQNQNQHNGQYNNQNQNKHNGQYNNQNQNQHNGQYNNQNQNQHSGQYNNQNQNQYSGQYNNQNQNQHNGQYNNQNQNQYSGQYNNQNQNQYNGQYNNQNQNQHNSQYNSNYNQNYNQHSGQNNSNYNQYSAQYNNYSYNNGNYNNQYNQNPGNYNNQSNNKSTGN